MNDPYINSSYANNKLESLPMLLKEKGYHTSFFHGATNGSMNFNAFAKCAGYDIYYGRTEFNNDTHYDGQWGIFDEPFLVNMVSEISNYRDMIKKGEVQYGPLTNLTARASAAIGSPTANALKQQEIESFLISQINEVLNAAKGVQAKDDALRAERQIKTYLATNSNDGMEKALELLEKTKKNVKKGNEAYINSLTGQSTPNKPTTPTTQNPPKNVYNVVRSRQGWTDATDAEIDAAIKAGKIKVPTGK
jgi:hypothetical protein